MIDMPDWTVWLLALALVGLFGWYFWHTGSMMLEFTRRVVATIQNWPEIRRAMAEAEAQSGGRYPLWFRAARVGLILALVCLLALLVWRKLAGT